MALTTTASTTPSDSEPGTPDWWVARLMPRLAAQAERAARLDAYYRNENVLPTMCPQVRDAYRRLMDLARSNYAELIVEAVRERMTVVGFRTGAEPDAGGDADAWALWQANALDADSDLVHRAKLSMAAAYVIVGKDGDDVVITPEDPRQVVAELDPVRRRKVRAALKVFHDDIEGADRLFLYLPGKVFQAERPAPSVMGVEYVAREPDLIAGGGWEWGAPQRVGNEKLVTVVPFLNRPDLYANPQGEFEAHCGHLDRIDYVVLNRLEVATLQAFRQRALKGARSKDEFGQPINYDDIFAADPGALWLLPETAEIWESGQVDLTPLLASVRADIEQLAAVTRTPMSYFAPAEANQSAEGAQASREALIFKVRDQLRQTGESWEQVMAIAFELAGDEVRADRHDMEVIWGDPERHSMAERADAAVKALSGGLTWRGVMEDIWQKTPQEIDRAEADRMTDALTAALAAPPAPAPTPEAPSASPGLLGASGGTEEPGA